MVEAQRAIIFAACFPTSIVAWAYRLYKKMSWAQMQVCENIEYAYENEYEYE
jgi:hypothetical protein